MIREVEDGEGEERKGNVGRGEEWELWWGFWEEWEWWGGKVGDGWRVSPWESWKREMGEKLLQHLFQLPTLCICRSTGNIRRLNLKIPILKSDALPQEFQICQNFTSGLIPWLIVSCCKHPWQILGLAGGVL